MEVGRLEKDDPSVGNLGSNLRDARLRLELTQEPATLAYVEIRGAGDWLASHGIEIA